MIFINKFLLTNNLPIKLQEVLDIRHLANLEKDCQGIRGIANSLLQSSQTTCLMHQNYYETCDTNQEIGQSDPCLYLDIYHLSPNFDI